ncbi:hypothetical protein MOTHE_c24250 [Moorella thermoacetica]|uniref:Uncharacterized protein n=1 Tax=Neomoorella thermoacetica TaxID=1525 RepID=A0A1J5NN88_NEOTH|nr:hypothetical protein MOTHE_c24250 [Moorella thermoacetica]AKX97829.1 hypothetical protein MOTHA_c24970 [Moorella thermoacetica]OIQ10007.1 hypothetical protein MOOR_00770 [Moorella thermoacetica]OIQ56660.1 hypothetical protein MOCA_12370 [Moorella thermoacetica]OIQ62533.1 hypothetical protein MTIN_07730 [Moorella thermoacetica]
MHVVAVGNVFILTILRVLFLISPLISAIYLAVTKKPGY